MNDIKGMAESKLQVIVDQGKASAARGIEALQREWHMRQDYVVKPSAIVPVIIERKGVKDSDKIQTLFTSIGGTHYNLTLHARGQLLERAGVPSRFADNLLAWGQGDLLVSNLILGPTLEIGGGGSSHTPTRSHF